MAFEPGHVPPEHQDLFGIRTDIPYTEAERRYSAMVQMALEDLLSGRRREIILMRRHHADGGRLAVMPASPDVARGELRVAMVERLLISTIAFMRDVSPGSPIYQRTVRQELIETQHFPTKHPHIVITRVDVFGRTSRRPLRTEWRLRRTQNQRAETQFNRLLDAANLALSVVKAFRGER